jgi:hypothetical protein
VEKMGEGEQKIITCILLMPLDLSARLHAVINVKDKLAVRKLEMLYYKLCII